MEHPSHVVSIKGAPNVDFGVVYVPMDDGDDEEEGVGEYDEEGGDDEEYAEDDEYAAEDAEEDGFVYEEEGQAAAAEEDGAGESAALEEDIPGSSLSEVTFGAFDDDGDERKTEATSAGAGAGADPEAGADAEHTATAQDATMATLSVANDSPVPVLLLRALCLPRVPYQSDRANEDDSEAADDQALFQTRLPAGGLVVMPGQEVQVTVFCVAPRFGGKNMQSHRACACARVLFCVLTPLMILFMRLARRRRGFVYTL